MKAPFIYDRHLHTAGQTRGTAVAGGGATGVGRMAAPISAERAALVPSTIAACELGLQYV